MKIFKDFLTIIMQAMFVTFAVGILIAIIYLLNYQCEGQNYNSSDVLAAQEKLLPCPWCGSSNVKFISGVRTYRPQVGCDDCFAIGPNVKDDSETWTLDEAVEKWNSIERK